MATAPALVEATAPYREGEGTVQMSRHFSLPADSPNIPDIQPAISPAFGRLAVEASSSSREKVRIKDAEDGVWLNRIGVQY
jgi:hypothetical protein